MLPVVDAVRDWILGLEGIFMDLLKEPQTNRRYLMENLKTICEMPAFKRGLKWEEKLFDAVADFPIFLVEDQPFQGPDGFSYMHISSGSGTEINKDDFFKWCFESGVGLVLNLKDKKAPDFVFNYGMVWNFLWRGAFVNEVPKDLKESEDTYVHELTENFLPKEVRSVIRNFLEMNEVKDPQLSLVSGGGKTAYEILWYLPELQENDEKDQMSLLEAISWFLPLDYRLAWAENCDKELLFKDL